jgi:hypothetical protein
VGEIIRADREDKKERSRHKLADRGAEAMEAIKGSERLVKLIGQSRRRGHWHANRGRGVGIEHDKRHRERLKIQEENIGRISQERKGRFERGGLYARFLPAHGVAVPANFGVPSVERVVEAAHNGPRDVVQSVEEGH